LREKNEAVSELQEQTRSLAESVASVKQLLVQEQSARRQAEEAVRALNAKLARFPVRLLVR